MHEYNPIGNAFHKMVYKRLKKNESRPNKSNAHKIINTHIRCVSKSNKISYTMYFFFHLEDNVYKKIVQQTTKIPKY